MSDRELPLVDGAPACPFVAFDDDRDARATAPDHRHRCYAEPRPAPRALAHQEAYCLSSAFPVCPTFQDWARREAAAATAAATDRAAPAAATPVAGPPPEKGVLPPPDREPRHAVQPSPTTPPQRNPPRGWSAPPPWLEEARRDEAARSDGNPAARRRETLEPEARGLSGSAADRLATGQAIDDTADLGSPPAAATAAAANAREAEPERAPENAYDHTAEAEAADYRRREAVATAALAAPASAAARSQAPRSEPVSPERTADQERQMTRDAEAAALFGPAWERPRRNEAYPTLQTRISMPRISSLALAAGLVLLAAVALYFLPGLLLGGKGGGTAAAPSPTPGAPAATPVTTATPLPTPTVYVITQNDTLSRVAKRFGLTLEQLLAANKQIKDPDKIKIGDQILIPTPPPEDLSGPSGSPGASPAASP